MESKNLNEFVRYYNGKVFRIPNVGKLRVSQCSLVDSTIYLDISYPIMETNLDREDYTNIRWVWSVIFKNGREYSELDDYVKVQMLRYLEKTMKKYFSLSPYSMNMKITLRNENP